MSRAITLLCVVVALAACPRKQSAIAELTKAEGPVEREQGGAPGWGSAPVGTKFWIGDAARTAAATADLLLAGAARVTMQPHTVLRFRPTAGEARIEVELGEI